MSRTFRYTAAATRACCAACLTLAACSHQAPLRTEAQNSVAIGDQSTPADIYSAMAGEYYKLGQLDIAQQQANKAITADKQNPRGYYMIAIIYERTGQPALAEENFKRALTLAPKNSDILNAYGNFFCSQRRTAEAQAQFAKAIENPLYTTPWVAMTNAGTCARNAGNLTQAEADYRRALAANPSFGPALAEMAGIELGRGNAKAAKGAVDRFFQANAPEPRALLLAAKTERKLGNTKAAATYEQILRQKFPDAPELRDLK
ncbi:type IV pilus biogenesis/stability protein PilW [uncultured Thiodictyon sp.]|uniref:type IV pilus biogenesis/stability protein PilW n=1 Tax=uncultured Thiodictyon sp. TaxID=1846217 RepID=UPI0025E8BD20|nr:type IV pilus biogenesis/stability protein PilW [uncultured Thiodictyon sp.]